MSGKTLNCIHLIGYVGQEPKVRWYDSETCSVRFSLATDADTHLTDEALERMGKVTDWHRVICYRALAEEVGAKLMVGDLVEVYGRLTYNRFYLKDGRLVSHTFVIAREITLLHRAEQTKTSLTKEEIKERYGRFFEELEEGDEGLPF